MQMTKDLYLYVALILLILLFLYSLFTLKKEAFSTCYYPNNYSRFNYPNYYPHYYSY